MGRKTITLITVFFGILCVILGFYSAFHLYGHYRDWNTVIAIGTWVSTFIVGLGIGFGFLQLREARLGTNAQIAIDMFEELRSKESLETLRFIYDLNPDNPVIVFNSDLHNIEYFLDRFNLLSILVKKGIVDRNLAIDTFAGASFLRCWYVLHIFINDMRVKQNRKSYCYPFEGFTHLCMEDFKKRGITVGFKNRYCKPDDNDNDLVRKLQNAKNAKEDKEKELYPRTWDAIEKSWKTDINQPTPQGAAKT